VCRCQSVELLFNRFLHAGNAGADTAIRIHHILGVSPVSGAVHRMPSCVLLCSHDCVWWVHGQVFASCQSSGSHEDDHGAGGRECVLGCAGWIDSLPGRVYAHLSLRRNIIVLTCVLWSRCSCCRTTTAIHWMTEEKPLFLLPWRLPFAC
jgi:hypothetical protein